jgi:TatD DNase family protein
LIDTHCHIFDEPLGSNISEVLDRAVKCDVKGIIAVSTIEKTWEVLLNNKKIITDFLPDSFFAIGIHPWFTEKINFDYLDILEKNISNIDGIGEIGLHKGNKVPEMEIQKSHFFPQMELSEQYNLPVFLHVLKAHDIVLNFIKEHTKTRGIIHAFSGSPAHIKLYADSGWLMGVGGGITKENAHRLRRVVSKIPMDSIVLETDSPYMGSSDVENGKSEPDMVQKVALKLSEIKNIGYDEIIKKTTDNVHRLFGVK